VADDLSDVLPDAFPEDSFVVRFGENTCTPKVLKERAEAHRRDRVKKKKKGERAISVNTAPPDASPDEIAARGRRPNPKLSLHDARGDP
jgi:hypothetical protein